MSKVLIRRVELALLGLAIFITFLAMEEFEVAERFYQFSRDHEEYELDEIILTIAFSFLYLSIYTLRRYFDLKSTHLSAMTDPMVEALNRRGGLEVMEQTLSKSSTSNVEHCLILFDIDNFKRVNDENGHDVGDIVLKTVAKLCGSQLRSTDALIRWGGEEFLILCRSTNIKEAANLAERIRMVLETTGIHPVKNVTASFGVAPLDPQKPLRDSIKDADQRQYFSKEHGKNCVTWQDG
jgi:diguanylate cyclase (GGDEF)-like protein